MNSFDYAIEYLGLLWFFVRTIILAITAPLWIIPYLIYKKALFFREMRLEHDGWKRWDYPEPRGHANYQYSRYSHPAHEGVFSLEYAEKITKESQCL